MIFATHARKTKRAFEPFFLKATSKERLIKFDNLKRMAHIDDEIKDPRVEELPDVSLVTKSFVFFLFFIVIFNVGF